MHHARSEWSDAMDTPQDRHDAYKTLGIVAIAHPDGTAELTGNVLSGAARRGEYELEVIR